MGKSKRQRGRGIIDRRYKADGSPTGYKGDLPFRAYCHYGHGTRPYSQCFETYKEAEDWKRDQDEQHRNRNNIGYHKRKEAERLREYKVADVIDRYTRSKYYRPDNSDRYSLSGDAFTLTKFCYSSLGQMSLFDVNGRKDLFNRYFKERENSFYTRKGWPTSKPVTARTVSKERNLLQRAFQIAIDENWFDCCRHLENPVRGIRIEGSQHNKNRVLLEHEEERLLEAFEECQGLNKYYGPLAMYIAMETGMRQGEIVNLLWSDIDYENRRIKIRKAKTDKRLAETRGSKPGRTIVLPVDTFLALSELWHHLNGGLWFFDGEGNKQVGFMPSPNRDLKVHPNIKPPIDYPDSHIFIDRYGKPLSADALGDTFSDAVKKAKLRPDENGETLTFHDLRRVANTMWEEAGLDIDDREIMRSGHTISPMDDTYLSKENRMRKIQDMLDRHVLKMPLLDQSGNRVYDQDGKLVWRGMTLEELVRYTMGRKLANSEIWHDNNLPLHYTPRRVKSGIKLFAAQAARQYEYLG